MLEVMDFSTCRCKTNLVVEDYLQPIQFFGGGLVKECYEEVAAGTSKEHVYDFVAEPEPDVFYIDDEIYKKSNENVESRMYDEVENRSCQSFENIYCTIISNSSNNDFSEKKSSEKNSNSSNKNSNTNSTGSWGTQFDCSSEVDDRSSRYFTWLYDCCCATKRVTADS